MHPFSVTLPVTLESVDERGHSHALSAAFGYRVSDPFAVTLTFATEGDDVIWTFGRDLLLYGSAGPAGEGDVQISPALNRAGQAKVNIELSSPDGRLAVMAHASDVSTFLSRSFAQVPSGTESEYFDSDLLISQLLAS